MSSSRPAVAGAASTTMRLDGPELIGVLAACMGLSALSIDLLLPAFSAMRTDLGLAADSTRISLVVTTYFLGLGLGQLVYGPLSDRFGRKPLMYSGMVVFVAASAGAVFAPSLPALLACRFLWGLGAAAPRSVAVAVARDTFDGDRLARSMSLIVAVYVLVPVVAPPVGTLLLGVANWRVVVAFQMLLGVGLAVWIGRLPETLAVDRRRSVSFRSLGSAAVAVARSRRSVAFGVTVTFVYAILVSYIGTAEIVIDEVFDAGDWFAVIFSVVALPLAAGSFLASRLVMRLGVERLIRMAVSAVLGAALVLWVLARAGDGSPPLVPYLVVLAALLCFTAVLIPTANAGAMQPVGHVAGMAAALIGTISTVVAAGLGTLADGAYDGTVGPFTSYVLAFAVAAAAAVFVIAGGPSAPVVVAPPEDDGPR